MISYITGVVEHISDGRLILDYQGIGYELQVPSSLLGQGLRQGEKCKIYTYLSVREDAISLFGFLTREDLELFKLLVGVNGIGPKAALSVLSALSADELRFAILSDDAATIAKAPGIGKKTAQKVILELKDKLDLEETFEQKFSNQSMGVGQLAEDSHAVADAVEALTALGYSGTEALQAVRKVEITEEMNSEAILKAALKHMF